MEGVFRLILKIGLGGTRAVFDCKEREREGGWLVCGCEVRGRNGWW